MADLSGVLRKTIDGLPRSTPDMRVRVYDKARAAIQRQIAAANPPLSDGVAQARLNALEDAIETTEQHYLDLENGVFADAAGPDEPTHVEPEPSASVEPADPVLPAEARSSTEESVQAEVVQDRLEDAPLAPSDYPPTDPMPQAGGGHSSWGTPGVPEPDERYDVGEDEGHAAPGVYAGQQDAWQDQDRRPEAYEDDGYAPFVPEAASGHDRREVGAFVPADAQADADYTRDDTHDDERFRDRDEPALDRQSYADEDGAVSIPEADVSGPAYVPPRKARHGNRSGSLLAIVSLVVIVGGLGAAAWLYGDEISTAILGEGQDAVATLDPGADGADDAPGGTPAATGAEPAADAPPPAANAGQTTRQYTQRLQPDGTEVDAGPAEREPNQFGEGTDVAAATLAEDPGSDGTTPTVSSEIGGDPAVAGAPDAAADAAPSETAAIDQGADGAVPVSQRTVFYQERTADQPGTQETGNVVWSVVNEPPIEGQPPEPAIRAVAEIPEENVTMTMTIRRNADPTLPASHVIEIMFDTPDDFPGGNVATVQRLALKQTEQARGEPLIGVAGKISDGFFIIALNNLDQAVENNLALLESQEWIDIPIAYATGRRALVSIEKGLPGDRVFKEAIASWDAKT
ncbi:hypothetical protein U0C82_16475 [Fulvimarina sp. 2208YS6-2-32]|uniref:Transcriptional regulator n=1 Tax=Fulvimarina uroteuthidis TaxID=3098149 RepID=A0ABU5I797_9HYPH|nr:hypothetical protein [Fulvimarina sp. 2208YS6-2-32]MDY8110739.1 hypothetical protein [Fulvimarina sp. 2208YS6-2-32]